MATTTLNSKKTAADSAKTDGVQTICGSSTSMIGEEPFRGIANPSVIRVFTRRGKKQQGNNEASIKSPSSKQDKGIGPGGSHYAPKTIGAQMEETVPTGDNYGAPDATESTGEGMQGVSKPPVIRVYTRRAKKQQVNEASNERPSRKQDKGKGPEGSNYAAKTTAAQMEQLKIDETAPVRETPKSEELAASKDNKGEKGAPAAAISPVEI